MTTLGDVSVGNRNVMQDLLNYLAEVPEIRTYAITGSRDWWDWRTTWHVLSFLPLTATQFNGCAVGADCLAGAFWRSLGGTVRDFPANWTVLGRSAGHVRNELMMDSMPRLVVGFLRLAGPSKGTRDALDLAQARGIPTFVFQQAA